jgi:hypothetical protein
MSGSINGLYIEGADNGTTQQSVIIDCNNGTNVAKLKAGKGENYVIENNLASYNSTVLYQGSNNVVLGKDNLNAQTNQSFNTAVGCSIFTKTTVNLILEWVLVYLKKQQLVGIMSASVIIHFQRT